MRLSLLFASAASALNNGLGHVPPMGYNSWYDVGIGPSATALLATADALTSTGLAALGFRHVNIDDGMVELARAADGQLVADARGFPTGMRAVADALHARNFSFGVYTDRGNKTCGSRAGAQGHEAQDAATYAAWGVDYVKEDSCFAPKDHPTAFAQYAAMRDGIAASGRPMLFSLCGWNAWYSPVTKALGNVARIGPDDTNWGGILSDIDDMVPLWQNAGPGGFNDPCLLLGVDSRGREAVTELQSRAQFSMWAVLAVPMLLSQTAQLVAGGAVRLAPRNLGGALARRFGGRVPDPRAALSPAELRAARGVGAGDDSPAVVLAACGTGAAQRWRWNVSAPGYLSNVATGLCANVDDCSTRVVVFECVTTGATCLGPGNFGGLQFALSAAGALTTPGSPGLCVAAAGLGGALALAPCSGAPDQAWAYDAQQQQLTTGGLCAAIAGAANKTAVFARPLADGGVALAFLNAGSTAADAQCDAGCLAGLGFEDGQRFTVRDLWARADLPPVAGGVNVSALPADGGIALLKISPLFDANIPPRA